jgi:hypothetical protein
MAVQAVVTAVYQSKLRSSGSKRHSDANLFPEEAYHAK